MIILSLQMTGLFEKPRVGISLASMVVQSMRRVCHMREMYVRHEDGGIGVGG